MPSAVVSGVDSVSDQALASVHCDYLVTPYATREGITTMSQSLTTLDTPAAIVERYGLSTVDSKATQAHLKAIRQATPATLVDALREHGAPLYAETDTLRADVDAAAKFVTMGKAAADAADTMAVRIVMTARQVNAKVTATSIGRAVEGDDADGAAFRKRWSRYSNAAKAIAARNDAKAKGLQADPLPIRATLRALQEQVATVPELLAIAASGEDLPTRASVAKDAKDAKDATPKRTDGADVLRKVQALADTVKALDASTVTPEQAAEIGRLMDSIRTRLTPAKPAAPKAS